MTALLRGVALTEEESRRLTGIEARIASVARMWEVFVHVPYFLIAATRP